MAISDKLIKLSEIKSDIKEAIIQKGQNVDEDMSKYAFAISEIKPSLQDKTAIPSDTVQTIIADSGYDGISSVTISSVPTEAIAISHSSQSVQVIRPSNGKYLSSVTIPRGVGVTPIFTKMSSSVGKTETFTIGTTIDPPETTSRAMSNMGTLFIVTVEDDDLQAPICFPFMVKTTEADQTTMVYPENGYSTIAVPSDSANYKCFETSVKLSVASYAITDEGVGAATIKVELTTESTSAEYNCVVYRIDRLNYS